MRVEREGATVDETSDEDRRSRRARKTSTDRLDLGSEEREGEKRTEREVGVKLHERGRETDGTLGAPGGGREGDRGIHQENLLILRILRSDRIY